MGLRFRRTIAVRPGVRLTVGRKSSGISIGARGFRTSLNTRGRQTTTISVPGTGLSYQRSKRLPARRGPARSGEGWRSVRGAPLPRAGENYGGVLVVLIAWLLTLFGKQRRPQRRATRRGRPRR